MMSAQKKRVDVKNDGWVGGLSRLLASPSASLRLGGPACCHTSILYIPEKDIRMREKRVCHRMAWTKNERKYLILSISVSICDNCTLRNLKAPTCPQLLYPDHSGKSPPHQPPKKTFGSTNLAPPPPHPTLPHPKSPTISSPPHTIAHVGKLPVRGEKGGKGT